MIVKLNGKRTRLPDEATLAEAVTATGADQARGVAVALDGEVVPRAEWEDHALSEGQEVEVVRAVQGG